MLPYAQALETILELPFELGREKIPTATAGGRWLAEPLRAPFAQPRFDNSAMDGVALRSGDVPGVPATLPLAGESAAGRRFPGVVPPGHAIRISTGAVVPLELDCIVPIEEVHLDGDSVTMRSAPRPGAHRRVMGSDVAEGSIAIPTGRALTAADVAFAASFNVAELGVLARPRVGILTSGDEIRLLGEALGPDDIVGSSIYYLEEELRRCGCEPRFFGVARDDADDFAARFGEMLAWADVLITTAGVSVGAHDVVGEVIQRFGGRVHFWKVAVRPGKPMLVASYGTKHHFGFPGNPVSTCCNTEIFLKPFLRRAFGSASPVATPWMLPLAVDCPRDVARLFFVQARFEASSGARVIRPLPNQNSGNLSLCAASDALIIVEPGIGTIPAGTVVPVLPISQGL